MITNKESGVPVMGNTALALQIGSFANQGRLEITSSTTP